MRIAPYIVPYDGTISGFKLNQPDLLDVDFTELEIKKKDITKNKEY